jgi:hypothetical protein
METTAPDPIDPRPGDPPFLFVILLSARRSGDEMLESLAHDWLAEVGVSVVVEDELLPAKYRKAVPHG